jgi:hypothetical protein
MTHSLDRHLVMVCLLFLVNALLTQAAPAFHAEGRRLVVLTETGRDRDGVPVLEPASGSAEISDLLSRGFSGRWLRLYQYQQVYLRRAMGSQPEPAYLLLSNRQGGAPFRFLSRWPGQTQRRICGPL